MRARLVNRAARCGPDIVDGGILDRCSRMEVDQIAASRRTLFAILGAGLVGAGLLLTCVVLPAEYGIDPLGAGKAMGLTGLARASGKIGTEQTPAPVAAATIAPVLQRGKVQSRWGESASVTGAFIPQAERFRFDSREIKLQPGEGMEIKYHMRKGAGLVYSWTASAPVLYDFHGQPDVAPAGAAADDDYSRAMIVTTFRARASFTARWSRQAPVSRGGSGRTRVATR